MGKPQFHVAIVGAGLGGLAAAMAIHRAGHKVTIFEQAPALGEVGAGIQVPPNSSRILKRWGVLDDVIKHAVYPRDFVLRSYRDGKVLSVQNMLPYAEEKYGAPYLHIHRADYHRIMVAHAEKMGIEIKLGAAVDSIDWAKPSLTTRTGDTYTADIIIGADGLKSKCRELLLGRPDPPHLTGDLVYRILVNADEMKKHDELRDLVETPRINYWMGPDSHAVCYLLKGGNVYNIVLACPDNLPPDVAIAPADIDEMMALFKNWDPTLRKLLGIVQETQKWRLQNSQEMESWRHPSGKFALMGDACHATLPYLAQGAAQAVEDGAVLGALFAKITDASQLKDILIIYEKLRKERTTRIVKGSTALRSVFHMHDGDLQQERDRQLLEEEPFEGYPNRWADPVFQEFMFGYDAEQEVEKAWKIYQDGKFPATTGKFKLSAKI